MRRTSALHHLRRRVRSICSWPAAPEGPVARQRRPAGSDDAVRVARPELVFMLHPDVLDSIVLPICEFDAGDVEERLGGVELSPEVVEEAAVKRLQAHPQSLGVKRDAHWLCLQHRVNPKRQNLRRSLRITSWVSCS